MYGSSFQYYARQRISEALRKAEQEAQARHLIEAERAGALKQGKMQANHQNFAELYTHCATIMIDAQVQRSAEATQRAKEKELAEAKAKLEAQLAKEAEAKKALEEEIATDAMLNNALQGCIEGNIPPIQSLLDRSAALREKFLERHPLHAAAENNRTEVIRFLVQHDFEITQPNEANKLPIEVAADAEQLDAAELLEKMTPLTPRSRKRA